MAIGRTAMPQLPSQPAADAAGAGPEQHDAVRQLDGEDRADGRGDGRAADFAITVDRDLKVETGKPATAPNQPAAPAPVGQPVAQPPEARSTGASTEPVNQ